MIHLAAVVSLLLFIYFFVALIRPGMVLLQAITADSLGVVELCGFYPSR